MIIKEKHIRLSKTFVSTAPVYDSKAKNVNAVNVQKMKVPSYYDVFNVSICLFVLFLAISTFPIFSVEMMDQNEKRVGLSTSLKDTTFKRT